MRRHRILHPWFGFTLWEVLIVMAIGLMLVSLGWLVSLQILQGQRFFSAREAVRRELFRARLDSLTGTQDAAWGVQFLPNSILRFQGATFSTRNPVWDQQTTIDSAITISSSGEVDFTRPEGVPLAPRTITLTDGVRSVTITVNAAGMIQIQ